jgi:alpha-glucoside transport system substrate-binding protein
MRFGKATTFVALATAATLAATGCSSSKSSGNGNGNGSGGSTESLSGDCAAFSAYSGHKGKTVSMYASITDPEGGYLQQSWKQFEDCTGIKINYTGDKSFETQLKIKVQGGNAPDIAIIPQPGLLQTFAQAGKLKPASQALTDLAAKNWNKDWISYGTVDGKFYAAPMGANLKSLVWYSPKYFKDNNLTVPETWDDMITLSNTIAGKGIKPWCVGIESGTATGWPLTDWMEEVMLRLYGPDVYDQWVSHQIPFNDPKVLAVLKKVGDIVKNPDYVNGGFGDVKSIATTAFQKGGLPILQNKCALHQQASFYASNWPAGTKVGPDGDVFAFYEPTISSDFGKPVEGGGEFVAAFSDKPEVQAVQLYLASGDWATARAKVHSGWVSANKAVDQAAFTDPVDALSVKLLTDPSATFRFDGSDAMPSVVGSGSFWKQMTQWILGQGDQQTLDKIEATWPK